MNSKDTVLVWVASAIALAAGFSMQLMAQSYQAAPFPGLHLEDRPYGVVRCESSSVNVKDGLLVSAQIRLRNISATPITFVSYVLEMYRPKEFWELTPEDLSCNCEPGEVSFVIRECLGNPSCYYDRCCSSSSFSWQPGNELVLDFDLSRSCWRDDTIRDSKGFFFYTLASSQGYSWCVEFSSQLEVDLCKFYLEDVCK